jgi:predicted transposase/invertase (TIGR01784 family)
MALEIIHYRGEDLFCPKYDRVFKAVLLGNDGDYTLLASFLTGAEVFEIHFIELPKFPENAGGSMKELWIKFLTAKKEEDLDMLTQESPVMAAAVNRLVYASGTKELREQMDDYMRNEMKNRLTMAAERKEGRAEGRVEIAKKALDEGLSVDIVAKITGLTVDEILCL